MLDCITLIRENCSDESIINLLSTTKATNECKKDIQFTELVNLRTIVDSPFFNNFTKVCIDNTVTDVDNIKFPASMKKLVIKNNMKSLKNINIPPSTTTLIIDDPFLSFETIPSTIKKLVIMHFYSHNALLIPPNVTCLKCKNGYLYGTLNKIPDTITNVEIIRPIYGLQKGHIPSYVTKLTIGYLISFNKGIIPDSVTHLKLLQIEDSSCKFYIHSILHPIVPNKYPSKLLYLEFGGLFNETIRETLPDTLISLITGNEFSHSLFSFIPPSLIYLKIGKSYPYSSKDIPSTVKVLSVPKSLYEKVLLDPPSKETIVYIHDS